MAPPDDDDHDCGWKQYAKQQDAKLADVIEKLAALERRVLGKKSEKRKSSKLPPPLPPESKPEAAAQTREQNALLRAAKLEVSPAVSSGASISGITGCQGASRWHGGTRPRAGHGQAREAGRERSSSETELSSPLGRGWKQGSAFRAVSLVVEDEVF